MGNNDRVPWYIPVGMITIVLFFIGDIIAAMIRGEWGTLFFGVVIVLVYLWLREDNIL